MIALGIASTSLVGNRDRSLASVGRHLLLVLVAVALLVGASASSAAATTTRSTTPDPCAGQPATVAAEQAGFSTLSALGGGWATADGYVPVPLPDGRTAWLMSDTLLAPPAADPVGGATFVHNSIVVQRGRCFTPVMGGTAGVRADLVPDAGGRACWPSAGVAQRRQLVVLCTEVEQADGPTGFGFRVVGTDLATFELPSVTLAHRVPLPFAEPDGIRWGTGALRDGHWVYIYGAASTGHYVARVRFDRMTIGPWRFWTGRSWGPRDALAPMRFTGATPARPAFVTPSRRGYVAVAFASPLPDRTIAGWAATQPQGPWRRLGTVATATTAPGQFAYDARAVDLGKAGWALVYNVNDPVVVATDPSAYGGRFVAAPQRLRRAAQGASK